MANPSNLVDVVLLKFNELYLACDVAVLEVRRDIVPSKLDLELVLCLPILLGGVLREVELLVELDPRPVEFLDFEFEVANLLLDFILLVEEQRGLLAEDVVHLDFNVLSLVLIALHPHLKLAGAVLGPLSSRPLDVNNGVGRAEESNLFNDQADDHIFLGLPQPLNILEHFNLIRLPPLY